MPGISSLAFFYIKLRPRTANMQNGSFSKANLTQVSTVRDGTAHRINGLVADEQVIVRPL